MDHDRDMTIEHNNFSYWDYSLMYDADEKEYVIAEVYFNKKGDPLNWCEASIANTNLSELNGILKRLLLQVDGGLYFIAKGNKITKHKGRAE